MPSSADLASFDEADVLRAAEEARARGLCPVCDGEVGACHHCPDCGAWVTSLRRHRGSARCRSLMATLPNRRRAMMSLATCDAHRTLIYCQRQHGHDGEHKARISKDKVVAW